MLEPNEKAVFDGMVTQLRTSDPRLSQRLDRLCRPRHRIRMVLAVLLWTLAPICVIFGGWTGAIMAVAAVGYGTFLYHKRDFGAGETSRSSARRPGVPNEN